MTLESFLNSQIKGQEKPLREICDLLDRSYLEGMRFPDHPIASILFLGPTGVGKTQTVLLFTEKIFGPDHLARFDMSEFRSESAFDKMLGSPGSKGIFEILYDRTQGRGTLLWDELEKSHPLLLDELLQILDAGRITVSGGRVLDLTNYIFAATSNVGSKTLMDTISGNPGLIQERAENAALETLRPEILGRFDLLTTFDKLSESCKAEIVRLHTDAVLQIMEDLGHYVGVTQRMLDRIQMKGYTQRFGARPIRRKAMELIGNTIRKQGGKATGTVDYDPKTGEYGIN